MDVSKEEIKRNRQLVEKYPFLLPRNRWDGKPDEDYSYEYTELDAMPSGWRKAFGEQMCEEVAEALREADYLDAYRICDIKEKYGTLRWYDFGAPDKVYGIVDKYENISARTCINCGETATKISQGWISPFCDKCASNTRIKNFVPIDEWFREVVYEEETP